MSGHQPRFVVAVRLVLLTVFAFLALRMAWMGDDALITLRTALNITHGWGPGFNATESVQAYTHPLWFLLWVTIGNLTNQWILGVLLVSVALSLLAVGLVLWRTQSVARMLVATSLLLLSNAFMDYTSSGLENALAYVLVGVLLLLSFRTAWTLAAAILAGLALAALVLTRLDLALLVLPAAVVIAWTWRRTWRVLVAAALAAVVPLIVWFTWSVVTYKAMLPNTFEAKRNVMIPATELVARGLAYLWVTFSNDPVSLIAIAAGVVMALLAGPAINRAWAAGIVIYLAYVVWIGGDFMAGRFVAVPVYACVMLLVVATWRSPAHAAEPLQPRTFEASLGVAAVLSLVLLALPVAMGAGPVSLNPVTQERWNFSANFGVADERGSYSGKRGLSVLVRQTLNKYDTTPVKDDIYSVNVAASRWPEQSASAGLPRETPIPTYCIGAWDGIVSGPGVHFIDPCGLTDRFMAGSPFAPEKSFLWRMGHFNRPLPNGYWEAIVSGDVDMVQDPTERERLRQLWAQIR